MQGSIGIVFPKVLKMHACMWNGGHREARSNRAENLNALFFLRIAKHNATNPLSFQREGTSSINRSEHREKKKSLSPWNTPSFSSLIRKNALRFVREGCVIMERQIR